MKQIFKITFIALLICNTNVFGQKNNCETKIVQLKFDKSLETKSTEITDSILATAKLTSNVLVTDQQIKKFNIKIDTACCIYPGQMLITSHQFTLTNSAVVKLNSLKIPLCCGIPVAAFVDGKEIYRAMLWNIVSSFGNKSLTATLIGATLTFANQLPVIPDFRNSHLTNRNELVNCLILR